MTSPYSGANDHDQPEGRQHALLPGSGCTVVLTERKRKERAGRWAGDHASRGLRALTAPEGSSRLPVTCRAIAHGAWPQGHSLHPGEGAGAGTWSSGGLGSSPGTHGWGRGGQQGGVHLRPLLPLCKVVKRSPGSDTGMGLLEQEGCGWLFMDVASSSEPPPHHACHSLSPRQAQLPSQKTPSFSRPL